MQLKTNIADKPSGNGTRFYLKIATTKLNRSQQFDAVAHYATVTVLMEVVS